MNELKVGFKGVTLRIIAVVAGFLATAILLGCDPGPSLPASDKMSENFKKAAYEHWVAYHEVGACVLPSEVKPQNTMDQQVRELFDQCTDYDSKKLDFSGKLATDDLRRQYNEINDAQKDVKHRIDVIFQANGYEDADTILRKQLEEKVNPKKGSKTRK